MRYERADAGAASYLVKLYAILAKPFGYLNRGQRRKCPKCAYAPSLQCFENFRRRFEDPQRKLAEPCRFGSPSWNDVAPERLQTRASSSETS